MDTFLTRLSGIICADQRQADDSPFGISRQAIEVQAMLSRAASNDRPVLIKGNRGTGKGLAARTIHALSDRAGGPFMTADLSRIDPSDQAVALFGNGAKRPALTRAAADGTLYLSMIPCATDAVQSQLYQWLLSKPSARLICAINPDLTPGSPDHNLRLDLLQRLSAMEVLVPPLANRPDDILWLMRRFFDGFNARRDSRLKGLSVRCEDAAVQYAWPGNGRELRARMERAVSQARGDMLFPPDLFPEAPDDTAIVRPLADIRDAAERAAILAALEHTDQQILEAARRLSISRTTLWEKMRKFGIKASP
jgi:DNA-binding NtrC family response regulator